MDEKKAFEIRRKVLESGVDFEEYISKQQAEIDDQEDTISEAEDLIKQHWTDLQTAQAEIDALVEMLEEMLYSNSTKYREKAEALIVKLKVNDMKQTAALDEAYEWQIQHPQVDDYDVDWAREVIQGMIDENSLLASWQCLYTDGKEGIVCDDHGSQYCAKQAEIDVTYGKAFVAGKKNGEETMQDEIDALASAAIDFIDQMRVQGCEGYTLPAEYDTLVDVVNKYK